MEDNTCEGIRGFTVLNKVPCGGGQASTRAVQVRGVSVKGIWDSELRSLVDICCEVRQFVEYAYQMSMY